MKPLLILLLLASMAWGGELTSATNAITISQNEGVTFYILEYKGYYFDTCNGNMCLAINGYNVSPSIRVCKDKDCVRKTLKETGDKHLKKVWEVTTDSWSKDGIRIENKQVEKSWDFK